jgi:hypothetical protein
MSDDTLTAEEVFGPPDVEALIADNARLRAEVETLRGELRKISEGPCSDYGLDDDGRETERSWPPCAASPSQPSGAPTTSGTVPVELSYPTNPELNQNTNILQLLESPSSWQMENHTKLS